MAAKMKCKGRVPFLLCRAFGFTLDVTFKILGKYLQSGFLFFFFCLVWGVWQVNDGAPLLREQVKNLVRKWAGSHGPNGGHISVSLSANGKRAKNFFHYRVKCKNCLSSCRWRATANYAIAERRLTTRGSEAPAHGQAPRRRTF